MEASRLPAGPGEPGRICLVTAELAYLHRNGGIGTANWHLALALAEAGLGVHILYAGQLPDADTLQQTRQRLQQAGVGLTCLQQRRRPKWLGDYPHPNWHVGQSEWVAHILGQLHQEHHFDLIEFPELGALGFRALQARRAGLAFTSATMLVKLHSSNQWCREANLRWMHASVEMLLDYCERYSFDRADVQLAPCRYMLDYVASISWPVRPQAQVIPYIYPRPIGFAPPPAAAGPTEVVFFGRLETRKGLELFLQAARQLDPWTPITFLGSILPLTGGVGAVDYIHQQLGKRPCRVLPNLNQEQAIRYLISRPCLAVIPSLIDNYPNTLIECVTHRIPFVATRVGGIPEMVPDPELNRRLLCDSTPDDLLHAIRAYLDAGQEERLQIHERLAGMVDIERHNRQVVQGYQQILDQHRQNKALPAPRSAPLVTVAIAGTSAEGWTETLESLQGQTHERLEILLLDGPALASVDPMQRRAWQQREPRLRCVQHDQRSLVAQWQEALQEARGEFFLPLSAGTIALPRLVEKLLRGLQGDDLLAGLIAQAPCYDSARERAREQWLQLDRPTGGSRLLACLENVFGLAPALYRTQVLQGIGGFDADAPGGPAGWGLAVKLLHHGYPVDVAPEVLAQVRISRDVARRMTDLVQLHRYLLEQYVSTWTLTPQETAVLWSALCGTHQTIVTQARKLGRLEQLRLGMRGVSLRLRRLIPEPGRRWLRRSLRRLQGWWQQATGTSEPWRHPVPASLNPQAEPRVIPLRRTDCQSVQQPTGNPHFTSSIRESTDA